MRKFAFIPLMNVFALVAGLFVSGSFAQPRDLFAEFEAEETAAEQAKQDSIKAAEKAEADRIAAEKAAAEKKLAEEKAAEEAAKKEAEEKRLAEEKAKADSIALQKAEAEKLAAEKAAAEKLEADRAAEKVKADSLAAAQAIVEEKQADNEQAGLAAIDSLKNSDSTAAAAAENKNAAANEEYARAMEAYADSARIREDLAAIARDSAAVAQMIADSVAAAEQAKADSIAAASSSSSSLAIAPSSSSMSRRDLLGPVKVSKVNGIDEMKGRYRSPRKAMFMSLVVPGSGQLYVGGSTFTKVRGGVYLALEAALWGSWYYFSVYKYDEQVKKYKKFAKNHYSIGQYERKMRDLYDQDGVNYESVFRTRYLGNRESFCEGIYGTATTRGCYNRDKLYTNDAGFKNDFVNSPVNLGEEMENVSFDDAATVYQLISDRSYVLGWDDVEDEAVATSLGLEDPNSSTVVLGSSDNMKKYRSLRGKANDYADMQAWFFGGLILNHIVSAVDAALSANAFNKTLYQEDLSWYDRLHFDSGLQLFGGFGVNVQASWGF